MHASGHCKLSNRFGAIRQDYLRSAEEDEDFGISHLRAHAMANDLGSGRLQTVGEEAEGDWSAANSPAGSQQQLHSPLSSGSRSEPLHKPHGQASNELRSQLAEHMQKM